MLFQIVYTFFIIIVWTFAFGSVRRHFRKFHAVHQAVHSADTDVNAIITLKDELYLMDIKTFIIIRVDMKNKAFDALIFRYTWGSSVIKVFIISTSVDIKHTTQGFNIMLETKPMYGV